MPVFLCRKNVCQDLSTAHQRVVTGGGDVLESSWETHVRVASPDGAAITFAAVPVPAMPGAGGGVDVALDVELTTPNRVVRYFARHPAPAFTPALAEAWLECAAALNPELDVATVSDESAGLSMMVLESTDRDVTLEFSVVEDLDAQVREYDGIAFTVARSALVAAAHRLRQFTSDPTHSGWSNG